MVKNTHTIQDVEGLMHELVGKIKDAETKTEKQALIKKLKSLERHYNDCNDKHINGKKYPERIYHSDDKPMNKKEVLKLIDSVPKQELVEVEWNILRDKTEEYRSEFHCVVK